MSLSKTTQALLSLLLLFMLLALPFLVSSGAVTQEALYHYEDALYGEDDLAKDITFAAPSSAIATIASSGMTDVVFSKQITSLPVDTSPGKTPIKANYTDTGYVDDTIAVEMEQLRMFESDVFVARVRIATPSQLRTAYAGNKMNSTRTNHTSRLATNYNGIAAINGDYYPKTRAGYIVRQGEVYREKTSENMDLLLIDELGDFHIIPKGHNLQKEAVENFREEHQLINGFFFGPGLIIGGEEQEIPKNYQFDPNSPNPRAAIGQTGPLSYVLVVVNGRTEASRGVTMKELGSVMKEIGCLEAYNLDGGNSATLSFNNQVYNDKPQAERSVTDIIYFASATNQSE